MVSTTSARVLVAGCALAFGVVLTLHFLFKKKKGKSHDKNQDKDSTQVDKDIENKNVSNSASTKVVDHVDPGSHVHGKRKHPNDDFINSDVQSPKKPHEVPAEKKSAFDDKTKPDSFDFFKKELKEFLSGDDKENINQNANPTESSSHSHDEKPPEKNVNKSPLKSSEKNEGDNKAHSSDNLKEEKLNNQVRKPPDNVVSEVLIRSEVVETMTATKSKLEMANPSKLKSENSKVSENMTEKNVKTEMATHSKQKAENQNSQSNGHGDPLKSQVDIEAYSKFSSEEISDALLVSQTSPGLLSGMHADVLASLVTHPDPKLQDAALNGINRCSTFTRNQNLFREHGCLSRLSNLLYQQKMSKSANPKVIVSVANAITNLSSNEENHKKLEDCVATLVDLTLEDETGESVCLSSLQALTNLSLTDQHHGHYTRLVQRLYDLVDKGNPNIKLQAAKVLVNLSNNQELVPHMLAAKAPSCSAELLKQTADENLLLRWITLLANILTVTKDQKLTSSSLPADDKAPSPETMYTALYGVNNLGQLKSKVYLLSRHKNENISHQASIAYQVISKM